MTLQLIPKKPDTEAKPSITLYSLGSSPNGQKVTILLGLLDLDYTYKKIDIYSNEHKQRSFLKMNPNGRIPVLTDTRTKRNGEHSNGLVTIFETGAILTYLAEEYDLMSKFSYRLQQAKGDTFTDPQYVTNYWDQVNWLMFQISDHSPVQGQLSTFQNLSKQLKSYNRINEAEEFELAANWYKDETVRVFQIYEDRLIQNNGWLVGQGLNIVDISAYPWIIRAKVSKTVEFDQFPEILQWVDKLEMFEKVRKGMQIG